MRGTDMSHSTAADGSDRFSSESDKYIKKSETKNSKQDDTEEVETFGLDISTSTLIEGIDENDPRHSTPSKMETTENGKIKRNTFACVRCHSLKQKCVPSDTNDIYRRPCERCLRTGKLCKFDLSKRTRKRRLKSDPTSRSSTPLTLLSSGDTTALNASIGNVASSQLPNTLNIEVQQAKRQKQYPNPTIAASIQPILPGIQQSLPDLWLNIKQPPAVASSSNSTKPLQGSDNNNANSYTNNRSISPGFNNSTNSVVSSDIAISKPMAGTNLASNAILSTSKMHPPMDNDMDTAPISTLQSRPTIPSAVPQNIKANKPFNSHLITHEFKTKLQSLLRYQKAKIIELSRNFTAWSNEWNELVQRSIYPPTIKDPVTIGILNYEEASLRLSLYKKMTSETRVPFGRLPFGRLDEDTTVKQLQREKPVLLSVIMSCVSVVMSTAQTNRDTIMKLDGFVINLITNEIFKSNNKSIEMIEALSTLCLWYNFLEWSSKTRYHLFNYICCCLTKDLGPTFVNRSFGMFSDEDPCKYKPDFKTPLELNKDGARLTIWVYVSSLNISIFLRQSIQSRWNNETEQACNALLQSPSQSSSFYNGDDDQILILFAKLNHILEKIHIYLHEMDQPWDYAGKEKEFTDKFTTGLIKKFENELDEIFQQIPPTGQRILIFYYSVEAYLHQYKISRFVSKSHEHKFTKLPIEISDAFRRCYECCTSLLREFLKLSPELIAALPLFHMSRIMYTVGLLLLKLRYAVIALPLFHHLLPITEATGDLVNKVDEVLKDTSELYPYNTFLYKIQYVVALFSQTYANKLRDLADSYEKAERENKPTPYTVNQFNPLLLRSSSDEIKSALLNTPILTTEPNFSPVENIGPIQNNGKMNIASRQSMRSESALFDGINTRSNNTNLAPNQELKISPFSSATALSTTHLSNPSMINNDKILAGPPYGKNLSLIPEVNPSPSASSDNLNEYLTDINSLAWGFNALNDEFWTDLFITE
ncbi:War1p NDAI_0D03180 [Naumovozyma dairenensis CBS 421]|uniref:Zn(2)-C6 fungal-type domain-containing protein n=1 Tax=Naumovozyma dairenensis (strain ATCC 10597 / BCRC 20456 / CBS 421 / NBRC 0211 / NRRL Y-12639) TaxID=1071378 RepID=G0WA21_NAUDC|nr:hypothetical protein NDAI_0D03180 [Naumovozyma dairenensis CBS 421]CCD24632.1 hypothetical protein NDAI_0D03180 [Naumovozyma dairenensis CBS 421]